MVVMFILLTMMRLLQKQALVEFSLTFKMAILRLNFMVMQIVLLLTQQ